MQVYPTATRASKAERPPTHADVTRWLAALSDPSHAIEVRALGVTLPGSPPTAVRRFKPGDYDAAAREALKLSGHAKGIYFVLNGVKPALLSARGSRGATAADVPRRINLLIDMDPERPADVSATAAEKAAAVLRAGEVRAFLDRRGWPAPVAADPGNGAHLVYRIDLPADDGGLVKAVLAALADRFDTAECRVDRKVFDAPRLVKLYGTIAAKGEPTADRPHRRSRVVTLPRTVGVVPEDQLRALAAEGRPVGGGPTEAATPPALPTPPARRSRRPPIESRASMYLARCEPAVSGRGGHDRTLKVAVEIGPGYDLPPETAFRLLSAEYNPRCEPPWSERELRHKVEEAYRVETRRGWHLDDAARNGPGNGRNGSAAPPVPPAGPPAPPAAPRRGRPNEAVDDPHRLARMFARQRARQADRLTMRYWLGEWHRWDGSAYRVCPEKEIRAELTRFIKAEFNRVNDRQVKGHTDPDKPPPTVRPVTTKLVANVIQALAGVTLLGSRECRSQPAWIDAEPPFPAAEILPARNGLVHVPGVAAGRRTLYPPTPRFFCPYALDYDFAPDAPEPVNWLTFLGARPIAPDSPVRLQLWPDDAQARDALQEWFGLNLLPDTRYQKICAIIGPKRCGKGTIARVLTALVGGENVANPTLSSLGTNFGLAPLIGKLAGIITDARLSGRADIAQVVERLLSISGEDGQTIDRKHQTAWTGRLSARFTLISNEIPRLADASMALSGRMVLLRLTKTFYGAEDERLMEKLLPELPGILLWAIEGWKRLRDRGRFVQPESGGPLVKEMEEASSPMSHFVEECCEVGPDCSVSVDDLFNAYQEWCKRKNRNEVGDVWTFGRQLRAVLPEIDKLKPRRHEGKYIRDYKGIELRRDIPAF